MEPKVDGMQKAERSKMLHILSDKKRRAFYETQAGLKGTVLFEESIPLLEFCIKNNLLVDIFNLNGK